QAEDGIRHRNVTGVQTCALPIFTHLLFLVLLFFCIKWFDAYLVYLLPLFYCHQLLLLLLESSFALLPFYGILFPPTMSAVFLAFPLVYIAANDAYLFHSFAQLLLGFRLLALVLPHCLTNHSAIIHAQLPSCMFFVAFDKYSSIPVKNVKVKMSYLSFVSLMEKLEYVSPESLTFYPTMSMFSWLRQQCEYVRLLFHS